MTGSDLGTLTLAESDTFERLVQLAARRTPGRGVKLSQVGDAGVLAQELHSDDPDEELVEELAQRLGLEPEDLETITTEGAS